MKKIVGIAGSFNRPSKSSALVRQVATLASSRYACDNSTYDLANLGPSLGLAKWRNELDERAAEVLHEIVSSDVLIIGSPTYKGSYPGLFKHLLDLIEPHELRGKPVIITATGGGERHALVVEHQLRPLFGFFMSHTLPTAIYASDREFTDYRVTSEALLARIDGAVDELSAFFPTEVSLSPAA